MIANYEREKLINTILYFVKNTEHCGILKLFKLLYFLDFEHYKKTGRSVTGLQYFAWKMGPVPVKLYDEIPSAPDPDLAEKVSFKAVPTKFKNPFIQMEAKSNFDPSHFSKRELKLMEQLASEYKSSMSEDMIEATHIETLPWYQVYHVENRRQEEIPYDYALRKDEMGIMNYIKAENQEISDNYK